MHRYLSCNMIKQKHNENNQRRLRQHKNSFWLHNECLTANMKQGVAAMGRYVLPCLAVSRVTDDDRRRRHTTACKTILTHYVGQ